MLPPETRQKKLGKLAAGNVRGFDAARAENLFPTPGGVSGRERRVVRFQPNGKSVERASVVLPAGHHDVDLRAHGVRHRT